MIGFKHSLLLFSLLVAMSSQALAVQSMVVTERREATQAGISILEAGGNAIDAAVAIGYVLAVVYPCCGNIGGGGFMTLHLANGKNTFINFREKAPANASKNMYLNSRGALKSDASTKGFLAVAVPGTVLGLDTALQKYGTMTRKQVMAPAIQLASRGYHLTSSDTTLFKKFADIFRDESNVAKIFLDHGRAYAAGSLLIQNDLAKTLTLIADYGPDVFYKGELARDIVDQSHRFGGILTLADFADYRIQELAPIQCKYHQFTIISAPPPSSGGVVLCEMLNILENFSLKDMGYQSAATTHVIVETMRYGFTDRNQYLGDPDFIANPVTQLLAKPYAQRISEIVRQNYHVPVARPASDLKELTDTTHYSVVDSRGNAVSVTYTLNGFFGAKVIAGNTGFFLNDEMDDFTAKKGESNKFGLMQGDANQIAPGKRPLSSMAPTIVLQNEKLFLVLGSPGGPRIITSLLLTLLNVLDFGMTIQQAVDAPRFHYQVLPDVISTEPLALPFFTRLQLGYQGYQLMPEANWSAVEAILIDPVSGELQGANDSRRPDGLAIKTH